MAEKKYENLQLDHQLCFPLYALSRLVNHEYTPYFEKMNLTYPQYLVLMVLWEADEAVSVNQIANQLILNTNTITPLLQRMEQHGFVERSHDLHDDRKVLVSLTPKGLALREECLKMNCILSTDTANGPLTPEELIAMHTNLWKWIHYLQDKNSK